MFEEFKKFISRGNVMDLAIGIIIGGAFQKIVTSLVSDIVSPGIAILTGRFTFSEYTLTLGNATIKYGNFFNTILDFLITAFTIFLIVRYLNKFNEGLKNIPTFEIDKKSKKIIKKKSQKNEETIPEPSTKTCPFCYTEINFKASRCPNCTSLLEELQQN